ncbi:hypothetical protein [uncultured Duncaniella sp.]|uniref:hypothetical protein n=1 Tax=uncultured Duncaniella sp. TaxID=2768039 RepID=UPI0026302230|nr:hypothetical protein [uncultured Duncaniella sp.]
MITNVFNVSQSNELTVAGSFSATPTVAKSGIQSITFEWNGSPKEMNIQDYKLIEVGANSPISSILASESLSGCYDAGIWWVPCGIYMVCPARDGFSATWNFHHLTLIKYTDWPTFNMDWSVVDTYTGLQPPTINKDGVTLFTNSDGWYLEQYQTYNVTLYK